MKTALPQQSEHVATQLAAIMEVIRELVGNDLVMLGFVGKLVFSCFEDLCKMTPRS